MDPTLHNKVYGGGINKEIILGHTEYFKPCHLYYIIKNYVRRVKFKIKS